MVTLLEAVTRLRAHFEIQLAILLLSFNYTSSQPVELVLAYSSFSIRTRFLVPLEHLELESIICNEVSSPLGEHESTLHAAPVQQSCLKQPLNPRRKEELFGIKRKTRTSLK